MEDLDASTLTKGRKTPWFDNHRKFLLPDLRHRRNKKLLRKEKLVRKCTLHVKSRYEIPKEIESFGLQKVTEIDGEDINCDIRRNHSKYG